MYRALFVISAVIFLLLSCMEDKPKEILDRNDMIDLMVETHLLDGYLNTLQIDSARKVIHPLYEDVFQRYKLDSLSFEENLKYYFANPVKAEKMYGVIRDRIETMNKDIIRLDSIKDVAVRDSIRRVERFRAAAERKKQLITHAPQDSTSFDFVERTNEFLRSLNDVNISSSPLEWPEGPGVPVIYHKLYPDTLAKDFSHHANTFNDELKKYLIRPKYIERNFQITKDTLTIDSPLMSVEKLEIEED